MQAIGAMEWLELATDLLLKTNSILVVLFLFRKEVRCGANVHMVIWSPIKEPSNFQPQVKKTLQAVPIKFMCII